MGEKDGEVIALHGLLEKIIFKDLMASEDEINDLKGGITDLFNGKITPKKLKEIIINSRFKILEELLGVFPYYITQTQKRQSITKFAESGEQGTDSDSNYKHELEEKNQFLEQVGLRIKQIYEKVAER